MIARSLSFLAAALASLILMVTGPEGPRSGTMPAAYANEPSREYLIKAAFLYNFAKFTEWPASAFADRGAPLHLCVLGEDPFGAALESIEGREIRGRAVAVLRIASLRVAANCHLLFISDSEEARLRKILESLRDRPVLTVADMPNFARAGGIISLKTLEEKIRFEINNGTAKRAGLKLSSKLLNLAEIMPSQN
ncbi:MAG: YfiR family protein [Kiloniellaceae bacterium]